MSEANVNSISGLGTAGIKINSPVGINTNPTSDGLTILGHVSVVNSSAEVVTVASENFGVKIKGSSGTQAHLQDYRQFCNLRIRQE